MKLREIDTKREYQRCYGQRQNEKILRKVRSNHSTLEKVLWFGLGAMVSIALTEAIKGSAQKGKQSKERELEEKRYSQGEIAGFRFR